MFVAEEGLVTVNGIAITPAQIDQELHGYSGDDQEKARQTAVCTLVTRELLLQEAVSWGLCDRASVVSNPEQVIERLLAEKIEVPVPDEKSCKRYFNENRESFATAPECEVSHIFFSAALTDQAAREAARQQANAVLEKIKQDSDCFEEMARQESACASSVNGGYLGRISKGQTVPAFESALMAMSKGDISERPVETGGGFHIIRVDEREDGEDLPFEILKTWIRQNLINHSRQKAVDGYVKGLANKAEIVGFDFAFCECD
jgi:peptidyl-prolyl cis-trans isomerase C